MRKKAEALDSIQHTLGCCGVGSYRDWFSSPWSMEQQPPNGCELLLHLQRLTVRSSSFNAWGIYHDGCFSKVYNFVSDHMFYIATAALGLALLQVDGPHSGLFPGCSYFFHMLNQLEVSLDSEYGTYITWTKH